MCFYHFIIYWVFFKAWSFIKKSDPFREPALSNVIAASYFNVLYIPFCFSVLQCSGNQGLSSDGRCKSCKTKNCNKCNGKSECIECASNYNLNKAKQCVACAPNCDKCNGDTKKCIQCRNGSPISYGVTATGSCSPCLDFCASCDGNQKTCKTCQDNYALNAAKNQCLRCATETCLACKADKLDFCTKVSFKLFLLASLQINVLTSFPLFLLSLVV